MTSILSASIVAFSMLCACKKQTPHDAGNEITRTSHLEAASAPIADGTVAFQPPAASTLPDAASTDAPNSMLCDRASECLDKAEHNSDRDPLLAQRYFVRACELNDARGCDALAGLLCSGYRDIIPRDERLCVQMTQKACNLGDLDACRGAGNLYQQGSIQAGAIPRDLERAASLFEQTCRAGDPYSCAALADCYADGRGLPRDPKRAKYFWRVAHRLGYVGE